MSAWTTPNRGPMIHASTMTEAQFLSYENKEFKHDPTFDSKTCRAYVSDKRILMFDIHDGHLAWNFDRVKGRTDYRCDCIRRGQATLGVVLP
jgi:hypothetical protein